MKSVKLVSLLAITITSLSMTFFVPVVTLSIERAQEEPSAEGERLGEEAGLPAEEATEPSELGGKPARQATESAEKAVEPAKVEQIYGKITDVAIREGALEGSMITLGKPEQAAEEAETPLAERDMKFSLDEHTKITDGSRELSLEDLKAGVYAKVMYTESWFGKRVAQTIRIQR